MLLFLQALQILSTLANSLLTKHKHFFFALLFSQEFGFNFQVQSLTMSPYYFLFCLLICFSIRACNSRYLGLTSDDETRKQNFAKAVETVINIPETLIPSEMISPISEEFGAQQIEVGKLNRRLGAISTMKKKNIHDVLNEKGTKVAPSGNVEIISSEENLQQRAKVLEGSKRQERSMLGSVPSDTEEAVKSNENNNDGITEDVVVMDYAQPHRKPPIHNEKA